MHTRPMKRDDVPMAAQIASDAFREDELFTIFFPPAAAEAGILYRTCLVRMKNRLVQPGTRCFVAESDDEDKFWTGKSEILGYSFWTRAGNSDAAMKWKADSLFMKLERTLISAEMWYSENFRDRDRDWEKIAYVRNLTVDNFDSLSEYLELATLAVSPKYHRRGVGGTLLKWGIEVGKEEQIPVVLEGSPSGTQLYSKHGFDVVGRTEIFEGIEVVAMKLEPETI